MRQGWRAHEDRALSPSGPPAGGRPWWVPEGNAHSSGHSGGMGQGAGPARLNQFCDCCDSGLDLLLVLRPGSDANTWEEMGEKRPTLWNVSHTLLSQFWDFSNRFHCHCPPKKKVQ